MLTCKNCNNVFPFHVHINGKKRNLKNRKRCLKCSPFGFRNTSRIIRLQKYQCRKCGEGNPDKFSLRKFSICKKCCNSYIIKKGQEQKNRARQLMGGRCWHCNYSKYQQALSLHHLDPALKDPNFHCSRFWKWERLVKEIENCALVCANCHIALHAGVISPNDFHFKPTGVLHV